MSRADGNDRLRYMGSSETTAVDPRCPASQRFQFRPVMWQNGQVRSSRALGADPNGIALAINDNAQAVGGSGNCAAFSPQLLNKLQSLHAVLWHKPRFLWTKEKGMQDLGSASGMDQPGRGRGVVTDIARRHQWRPEHADRGRYQPVSDRRQFRQRTRGNYRSGLRHQVQGASRVSGGSEPAIAGIESGRSHGRSPQPGSAAAELGPDGDLASPAEVTDAGNQEGRGELRAA